MMLTVKAYNPYAIGSLESIIFALFLGACLAGFGAIYHRKTIGGLVHYLLEKEAFSIESAKTLREAELELNLFLRWTLKKSVSFRRIVCMTEVESGKKDVSLSDIPLYINPKERDRAEKMYSKYTASDATFLNVIISIAVFALIAYLSYLCVPSLISMAENIFKS